MIELSSPACAGSSPRSPRGGDWASRAARGNPRTRTRPWCPHYSTVQYSTIQYNTVPGVLVLLPRDEGLHGDAAGRGLVPQEPGGDPDQWELSMTAASDQ